MNSISIKDIENRITYLNKITNSPATYSNRDGSEFSANIGHYMSDQAYGGIKLARVTNSAGGTTDVLRCGYTTKKNFYNLLNAYIEGIERGK